MVSVENEQPSQSGISAYHARSPWNPWLALLVAALIFLGSAIAGVGASKLLLRLIGLGSVVDNQAMEAMIWLGFTQLFIVILTWVAARQLGASPAQVLAWQAPPGGVRDYLVTFFGLIAVLAIVNAVLLLLVEHDPMSDLRPFIGIMQQPAWPIALVVIGIGAPLSEELLFRGFLQSALAKSRIGFTGAALVCTVIWSSLHLVYSWIGVAEVALIGFCFCYALWRTGSTRVTTVAHAIYNTALALALHFLPATT